MGMNSRWDDKLRGLVVPALVSLVIGTGLISSVNFLLFDSPIEWNTIRQETIDDGTSSASTDGRKFQELSGLFSNDWLIAHLDEMGAIIIGLVPSQVSSDFVIQSKDWCLEALNPLTSAKGMVAGYSFGNETYQAFQKDILNYYDAEINLVNQLYDNIVNWNNASLIDKSQRMDSIQRGYNAYQQTTLTIATRAEQLLDVVNVQIVQFAQRNHDRAEKANMLQLKAVLALIVIAVGGIIILMALISLVLNIRKRRVLKSA